MGFAISYLVAPGDLYRSVSWASFTVRVRMAVRLDLTPARHARYKMALL